MEPGARGAERPLPIQTEPAAFPHAQPGWQKHTLPTTPPPPPRDAAAPAQPQITGALKMLSSSAAGRRTWWGGKAKHNGVYMPLGQSTGATGWPLIPVVAMGNAAHKPMAVLGSAGPGMWRKINPTAQGKKMSPPGIPHLPKPLLLFLDKAEKRNGRKSSPVGTSIGPALGNEKRHCQRKMGSFGAGLI